MIKKGCLAYEAPFDLLSVLTINNLQQVCQAENRCR